MSEIARLEDALLRFCPERRWQIKAVTFPTTANTDLDIAHTLFPDNPEYVRYEVIQAAEPQIVYHDTSATRTAWSQGIIRLRSTQPSGHVLLLLTESDRKITDLLAPPTSPAHWVSGPTGSAILDTAASNQAGSDSFSGPTLRLKDATAEWWIGLDDDGATDNGLNFLDKTAGYTPFHLRQFSGDYYLQPGRNTNVSKLVWLGNPNDSSFTGWWDHLLAWRQWDRGRSVAQGEWTSVAHADLNFQGDSVNANWVVASADQVTFKFIRIGLTMWVSFTISNSTVANTPAQLQITIPDSATAASAMVSTFWLNENGAYAIGRCYVLASGTTIILEKVDGAAFANATDTTSTHGQICFETTT